MQHLDSEVLSIEMLFWTSKASPFRKALERISSCRSHKMCIWFWHAQSTHSVVGVLDDIRLNKQGNSKKCHIQDNEVDAIATWHVKLGQRHDDQRGDQADRHTSSEEQLLQCHLQLKNKEVIKCPSMLLITVLQCMPIPCKPKSQFTTL